MFRSVGSATIAESARRPDFINSDTPSPPFSSSTVKATITFAEPRGFSRTNRPNAVSMTATPAFTSHDPRPNSFPPSTFAPKGSMVIASTGTVSWWASKRTVKGAGPGGVYVAMRLSRPGLTVWRRNSQGILRSSCSRNAVTRDSCTISGARSVRPIGFTDGRRTSSASNWGRGSILPSLRSPFQRSTGAPITAQRIPPPELTHEDSRIPGQGTAAAAGATVPRHIVVKSPDEAVAAFDQLGKAVAWCSRRRSTPAAAATGSSMGYTDKLGGVKFCTNKEKAKQSPRPCSSIRS